jgi:hypothetical protein
MLDVAMLLLVLVFFGLTIGYVSLCHRLLAATNEANRDVS